MRLAPENRPGDVEFDATQALFTDSAGLAETDATFPPVGERGACAAACRIPRPAGES